MYSQEKPKIKNKKIKKNKRYKLVKKTFAVGAATIVFLSSAMFLASKSKAFEPAPEQIISNYYGEDSKESDIVNYIELSRELKKINLEKYEIEPSLFERYSISNKLKSPEEINELISKIKFMNAFVSSKNITKQSENIEIVLNLVKQKDLINEYIYQMGYDLALYDIEQELNEYAEEVFGVKGDNLTFSHTFNNKSGDDLTSIENGNKRYNTGLFLNDSERDIKEGVITLNQTKDAYNKFSTEYDDERNNSILNALKVSAELSEKNDNNDLYNEKMASKLR